MELTPLQAQELIKVLHEINKSLGTIIYLMGAALFLWALFKD